MPTDRPTAAELLNIAIAHLEQRTLPLLEGHAAFHLRVTANALRVVARTLAEGDVMDRAELTRLHTLLGIADPGHTDPSHTDPGHTDPGGSDLSQQKLQAKLIRLNRLLAAQIRAGNWENHREQLLSHLRTTAADKLRLAYPDYGKSRD